MNRPVFGCWEIFKKVCFFAEAPWSVIRKWATCPPSPMTWSSPSTRWLQRLSTVSLTFNRRLSSKAIPHQSHCSRGLTKCMPCHHLMLVPPTLHMGNEVHMVNTHLMFSSQRFSRRSVMGASREPQSGTCKLQLLFVLCSTSDPFILETEEGVIVQHFMKHTDSCLMHNFH